MVLKVAQAHLCRRGDEGREEHALAAEPQRRSTAWLSPLEPLQTPSDHQKVDTNSCKIPIMTEAS